MRRWLLGILIVLVVVVIGGLLFFFLPAGDEHLDTKSVADLNPEQLVAYGHQVAIQGDCVACHSTDAGEAYAGGLAFHLPFGTIYSPNITSDKEHGIGSWTDAQFARAMRQGVDNNGQNLYPAFPYTHYTLMTDRDVLALRAYLNTVPASTTAPPVNQLQFPFDQRWGVRAWNLAFFRSGRYQPDASQSEAWNRGAYLVEGLEHCAECHTPRNVAYALDNSRRYGGAIQQGWNAYNISNGPDGIADWTDDELVAYLHTGHADGRGSGSGSMGEAVELSLRHLSEDDICAMVAYLRTIPATPGSAEMRVDKAPPAVAQSANYALPPSEGSDEAHGWGLRLFRESCASCHGWDGTGNQSPYASLLGSQSVNDPSGTNVMQTIIRGSSVTSANGREFMPAFGATMTDVEIAELTNYVIAHFGNKQANVKPADVANARTSGH